jgi:hypothetical protein
LHRSASEIEQPALRLTNAVPTWSPARSAHHAIKFGGGVILLKKPLLDMLDAAEVAADRDYFLVNRELASVLNSVGALFAVLFMAAKKRNPIAVTRHKQA